MRQPAVNGGFDEDGGEEREGDRRVERSVRRVLTTERLADSFDLCCGHRGGAVTPAGAHEGRQRGDVLVVVPPAEGRHRERRWSIHGRRQSITLQDNGDQRNHVGRDHTGIAGKPGKRVVVALGIEPVTGGAAAHVHPRADIVSITVHDLSIGMLARLKCRAAAARHRRQRFQINGIRCVALSDAQGQQLPSRGQICSA